MSPRENFDNLGTLYSWHRKYHLSDENATDAAPFIQYMSAFDAIDRIEREGGVALPVYIYDHSCVRLSTETFIGRTQHAEWDSGLVGIIYATRQRLREYFVVERISAKMRTQARELLSDEVGEFDAYLNGPKDGDEEGDEDAEYTA